MEPTKLVEEYKTRITRSYKKNAVDAVNVVEKVMRLKKGPILENVKSMLNSVNSLNFLIYS